MHVQEIITVGQPDTAPPDYRQVRVVIGGEPRRGGDGVFRLEYNSLHSHFDVAAAYAMGGTYLALLLPDTVAEHFRQEGRRQLQSELRALLNTARA